MSVISKIDILGKVFILLLKTFSTYETSFASRAGPISERVVKPVALKISKLSTNTKRDVNLPSTNSSNVSQRCWHTKKMLFIAIH